MIRLPAAILAALTILAFTAGAAAQSSSLYVAGDRSRPAPRRQSANTPTRRAAGASYRSTPRSGAPTRNANAPSRPNRSTGRVSARPGTAGRTYRNNAANPFRRIPRRAAPSRATGPRPRPTAAQLAGPRRMKRVDGRIVNPHLQAGSYMAVIPPEPRQFEEQDLITVIIREEASATSESSLDTQKETTIEGEVGEFPRVRLQQLLQGIVGSSEQNLPAVEISGTNEFQGEGEYERTDSMVTRLTARVLDVKPNGTLALEARTQLNNNDASMVIKVTGYCRAQDVTADNTILSTQMFDLRVDKQHEGELRQTAKKGFITRILEGIFNF